MHTPINGAAISAPASGLSTPVNSPVSCVAADAVDDGNDTNVPMLWSSNPGGAAQSLRLVRIEIPWTWFEVQDVSGTVYRFDQVYWEKGPNTAIPYALLSRITDRFGRRVDLTWEGGFLRQVVDSGGGTLAFSYGGGRLTAISDPHGRTHTLTYASVNDENGRPQSRLTGIVVQGPGSPNRVDYGCGFDCGTAAPSPET